MKKYFSILSLLCCTFQLQAQNVGIGTNTPNSNAILDISSSSKGLLLPRVADTNAVTGIKPAGLTIFSNSDKQLYYHNGSQWKTTAGSTGNLWQQKSDSVNYTSYKYVSINSNPEKIKAAATLQVNGSLLIQFDYTYSNSNPTAAQQLTMNNLNNIQEGVESDSVNRILDPGGANANYSNNTQGNVVLFSTPSCNGYKIKFNPADFGLGTGDTLWLSNSPYPGCRDNYYYLFTNTTVAPGEFTLSMNNFSLRVIFRSNGDGVTGKGFDISVTKLYGATNSKPPANAVGNALLFDPNLGALRTGMYRSEKMGFNSFAMGSCVASGTNAVSLGGYTLSNGDFSLSSGYFCKAKGASAFAGGQQTESNGNFSIAYGLANAASGEASACFGSHIVAGGQNSFATGESTNAISNYSSAMGYGTIANGLYSTVLGVFNDTMQATQTGFSPHQTDLLFAVGNGSSYSSRSNAMSILYNGKTGIGNVNPQTILHIKSTENEAVRIEGPTPYISLFDNNTMKGYMQAGAGGFEIGSKNNMPFYFYNGDLPRMTILSNGSVGVGTGAAVGATMHIKSPDYNTLRLEGVNPAISFYSGLDYMGFMQAYKPGNDLALACNAGYNLRFITNGGGFTVFNGTTTGTYTTSGWMHSSDEKLKTNIQPLESPLQKIMQLRGVQYNWKQNPNSNFQIGFIAQEVEKVFPEVTTKNADGTYTMAYQNLVAPLVEAIKEQQKQIEALKEEIKTLKNK